MKKKIFLIILFSSSIIFSQTKYFIYFADKGINKENTLSKSSALYKQALNSLSEKAIERRQKVLGNDFITFEDLPVQEQYIENLSSKGVVIVHKLKWMNAVSAYLTMEQLEQLADLTFIDKIEKVKSFTREEISSEDYYNKKLSKSDNSENIYNYGLSYDQYTMSEVPAVHNAGFSGQDVTIGLLDTGFRWKEHPALKDRTVIAEKDFVFNDNVTADQDQDSPGQDSHGTSVFSITGGFEEGEIIAPAFKANFALAKTEYVPSETKVEEDNFAAGVEWLENLGVDIMTSSLGYNLFDSENDSYSYADMDGETAIVTKAYNMAFSRGVLTVTSAGNEGNDPWKYITAPGDAFYTLTIGAVTSGNELSYFSSLGPTADGRIKPELTAMGSGVYMAQNSKVSFYKRANGTSFAAPIAAGIAAQVKSTHPYLNNVQLRSILIESGDNADNPNNEIGYGLISALRAVEFPNVKIENGQYQINKMFIEKNVVPSSVKISFSKMKEENFESYIMTKEDDFRYTYNFNSLNESDSFQVFFSYKLEGNESEFRFPENEYLTFTGNFETLNYNNSSTPIDIVDDPLPNDYILFQNYPNPFNPKTTIKYYLLNDGYVNLSVYNLLGEKVSTIVDEFKKGKKTYFAEFKSENLSSGVYIYRLETDGLNKSRKMILIK